MPLYELPGGPPFPFLRTEFSENFGEFSPDNHWVAYAADESGRFEIYVRPFSPDSNAGLANAGGKWLISTDGGRSPHWRGDGKELYYISPDQRLMAVEVAVDSAFHAGVPKPLFTVPPSNAGTMFPPWGLTFDGKRFLFITPPQQTGQAPFTLVLNWPSLLKK